MNRRSFLSLFAMAAGGVASGVSLGGVASLEAPPALSWVDIKQYGTWIECGTKWAENDPYKFVLHPDAERELSFGTFSGVNVIKSKNIGG